MGNAKAQGDLWGAAAKDWAELQEPKHIPAWEAVLEALHVGSGTRFLDAGCGSGGACVLAHRRGAWVTGIDAAPNLIEIARKRVAGGDFRIGDLESLPFPVASFDAVLAANSVQYCADPAAALCELARVCAPKARLAVVAWGRPEQCDMRDVFTAVVQALPAPPPGESPFALSASGKLEAFVESSGMRVTASGEVCCPFEYPNLDDLWRAQRSAGPLQGAVRAAGEHKVRDAVFTACRRYQTPQGKVCLNNKFRFVVAGRFS